MKKILLLLVLFVPIICSAKIKLEVNERGDYQEVSDQVSPGWTYTKITSQPEALEYVSDFERAIRNPGKEVFVEKSGSSLKLKSLFKAQITYKEYFIVYNNKTKNINFIESKPMTERKTSYLALLVFMSLIFMILSNIFYKKACNSDTVDQVSIALAAYLAFLSLVPFVLFVHTIVKIGVFSLFTVLSFSILLLPVLSIIISIISTTEKKKLYKIFSILFYLLMVIIMASLFI